MDNSHEVIGGLFVCCPLTKEVDGCPFAKVRNLNIDQQIDLVKEMSNDELEKMISHHKTCYSCRIKKDKGFRIVRTEERVMICQV